MNLSEWEDSNQLEPPHRIHAYETSNSPTFHWQGKTALNLVGTCSIIARIIGYSIGIGSRRRILGRKVLGR